MNPAHWHLLLNHLPVVGTLFGALLMGVALLRRSDELRRAAAVAFLISALVAVPVFLSGEPAEDVVERLPGVSERVIERHEDAAEVAVWALGVLGLLSLGGLVAYRRSAPAARRIFTASFAVSVVVCGLMARTANLGGQIRHSEIRSGGASAAVPAAAADDD